MPRKHSSMQTPRKEARPPSPIQPPSAAASAHKELGGELGGAGVRACHPQRECSHLSKWRTLGSCTALWIAIRMAV